MSQVQETGKAPVSERPSQVNDTAEQVGKQAERRTCLTCGHPDCPYPTNDDVAAKVAEDPDWLKHPECWQPLALDGLAEKAPVAERPARIHDIALEADTQEAAALEAIRKGLGLCGIEPDDWYWMANKILDVLKKSGILPFGVEDVIRKVLPNTQINRSLDVHVHERDLGDVTPDRALKLTRALSDAYGVDWLLEHYRRNDPRRMPAFGALKATIGNTNVCVFFEEIS